MERIIFALLLFWILIFLIPGCATPDPIIKWNTKIVEVKIPVFQCPIDDTIRQHIENNRPKLEIHSLTHESTDDEVFKAYPITIEQLIGFTKTLEDVIDSLETK